MSIIRDEVPKSIPPPIQSALDASDRASYLAGRCRDADAVDWRVRIEVQGNFLGVAYPKGPRDEKVTPKEQGTTFSKGSRLRMLKTINKLDWSVKCWNTFATTTWHDDAPLPTKVELTAYRENMHKRVCYLCGKEIGCIWRTEWMPRQSGRWLGDPMPHVHWVYFGTPHINPQWYSEAAGECQGVGWVRTDLQGFVSKGGLMKYVNKRLGYVAKEVGTLVLPSYLAKIPSCRHWGKLRSKAIPWAPRRTWLIDRGELTEVIREIAIQRYDRVPIEEDSGYCVFGDAGEEVERLLRKNRLPPQEECVG